MTSAGRCGRRGRWVGGRHGGVSDRGCLIAWGRCIQAGKHCAVADLDVTGSRIHIHFQPESVDRYPMAQGGTRAVTHIDHLANILQRTPERFPDFGLTLLGDTPSRTGN